MTQTCVNQIKGMIYLIESLLFASFGYFCITTWGGFFGSMANKLGDGEYLGWFIMVMTGSSLGMMLFVWTSKIDKVLKKYKYCTRAFPEEFSDKREETEMEMKKARYDALTEKFARDRENVEKKMMEAFKWLKRNGDKNDT